MAVAVTPVGAPGISTGAGIFHIVGVIGVTVIARITAVPPSDVAAFLERHPEVHWFIYPGVQHGFDNHTRPVRFDAAATALARERSLAFLREKIG